ncbi:MAG: efflux RND transporter periplasmic adaptor subunit [Syntrophomonadaceae bacterium]
MADIPMPGNDEHILVDNAEIPSGEEHISLDAQHVKQALVDKRVRGMSTGKKILLLLAAFLAIGAAVYGIQKWRGTDNQVSYATATVSKGTVTDSIEATGTLEAVRTSDMGFKNDDTITALDVQPGDHVTVGQVLARQDPATLSNALQQAQNTVDQDSISLKSSQLNLETARKELERQQQLFAANAISQSQLETAQNSYTKADLDLQLAQAKLANDRTKLAQAQENIAEAAIVAPFDGIIGAVNGQVGSINGINSASSTLLTVMSDELQINALVNEADIGQTKVGQAVEFISSSFGDKVFKGQVLRITPQAKTVSNVQYYPVLISCEDPERVLLSGMSVSAHIIIDREEDAVMVPMMAVSYAQTYLKKNPSASVSRGSKAVLLLENGQPVVKSVELGISDGTNYAVKTGLDPGDTVIIGTTSPSANNTSTTTTPTGTNRNQVRGPNGGMGGPADGI